MRKIIKIVLKVVIAFVLIVAAFFYKHRENYILYKPIGYFSSSFSIETGAPRQGMLDTTTTGVIVLDKQYTVALKDLDKFEYIWVLSHFDKVTGWSAIISPPKSGHKFGLFATRSPRRPNPIGLSLMKVDSIVKNKIYVRGVDLFDKTPIIDIKPFLPSVDYVLSLKNMEAEYVLGHHDEKYIESFSVSEFVLGK